MPVSCDPNDLQQAAACFKCIPTGMQPEVIIYLLNQLLAVPQTPQQLMDNAACFRCIPAGQQQEVMVYELCQIVNK